MVDEAFAKYNKDGDDKLNFDEFCELSEFFFQELMKYDDEDDFSDDEENDADE